MITYRRLGRGDDALAQRTFAMMAAVFEEHREPLPEDYCAALLVRADMWIIAALEGDEPVGGITAHVLPMTRDATSELFIYDLAVRADRQRRGIGRALIGALREAGVAVGIEVAVVPVDNDDEHALEFYRAIGGAPSPVTLFVFGDT